MSRLSRWLRSRRVQPPPPPTPYEHLLTAPRYEAGEEQLLGSTFRIPDGISFYCSYREIFIDEIYRFSADGPAPRIVDCGSNCGVSVFYFKQLFPASRIVAVEPDPEIFALLKWNLAQRAFRDVTLINKAITVGADEATFHREGSNAGRIHPLAESKATFTVPVVSLDDLLTEPVDLLKIDIEGAETEVLCGSERLDVVKQIMVEYHSFADSDQSLHAILHKLATSGFRYFVQTQFCPRRPLVENDSHLGMDLQLNIFARRADAPTLTKSNQRSPEFHQTPDAESRAA